MSTDADAPATEEPGTGDQPPAPDADSSDLTSGSGESILGEQVDLADDVTQRRGGRAAKTRDRLDGIPDQVAKLAGDYYGGTASYGDGHGVTTIINGDVRADGAVFGVRDGGTRKPVGQHKMTGSIDPKEVDVTVVRYAKPLCFAEGLAKLTKNQVLVIEGRPGNGRRAGAINLLSEAKCRRLVVLSPMNSLRDLAERDFDKGLGYLVLDRVHDPQRADLEFTWLNVKEKVRKSGAFLVITNAFVGGNTIGAVPHITWNTPSAVGLLQAQLGDRDDLDAVVDEVLLALGDDSSLSNLVAVARMIRDDGLTAGEALEKLDEGVGRLVLEWFASRPAHRDIVAAAALCFLEGTDVRTYETLLERLYATMADRAPANAAKSRQRDLSTRVFDERETRLHGSGLLEVRDEPWGSATIQFVAFKDEAFRRHVFAELWRTQTIHFWDAVREWLTDAVSTIEGSHRAVASGIAWLACSSVNEAQRCYLDPWSNGSIGWPGQVTATYALWFMCRREGLASIALETAVGWSRSNDIDRRSTAALAFGGDLGMCFPSDAVNRLWQLMTQNGDIWEIGCASMATLFATLSDAEQGDPAVVLNLLDRKMADFGVGAGSADRKGPVPAKQLMRLRNLTMSAAMSVITVNSIRTSRQSIIENLYAHPKRIPAIARIWAGVLTFRPLRWEAFHALRRGLHAMRDIDDENAPVKAREFGIALAEALPAAERRAFKKAFMQVDEQARRGRKGPPAEVLLACIEAITMKFESGGSR